MSNVRCGENMKAHVRYSERGSVTSDCLVITIDYISRQGNGELLRFIDLEKCTSPKLLEDLERKGFQVRTISIRGSSINPFDSIFSGKCCF